MQNFRLVDFNNIEIWWEVLYKWNWQTPITGPDWVVYVGFIIFAVLSIVLISGHGSWLISGYNTASKEEKAKYNEKSYAEQWELECLL